MSEIIDVPECDEYGAEIVVPNSVPDMLDAVDYSEDPTYVPSAFAIKVITFIGLMTDGAGEASPSPTMHFKMLDLLQHASSEVKFQRVAELAARGSSKTSLHSEILFFYIAVFGVIDNFGLIDAIIYISDTVENGVKSLKKNMEARYYRSEFLQKYIPTAVFNQTEIYLTNIDGVMTGIRMFGAQSGIRGVKIFGKRPQLAIVDDILSDKNAKSDGIIESINDTLYKGIDQALDPLQRKIVYAGTPFNEGDPLYVAIESGGWQCAVFPICEKFPCTREEFRGSWVERFTYDHILAQYNALKAADQLPAFYQELMLQINSAENKLVDEADINWFNRSDIFANKDRYYFYITTDFATSSAKSSDNSSISVWAVNSKGYHFWVDGILRQQTMDHNINDLFRLARKYSPKSVGIEINGQQAAFIPWIKRQMVQEDTFFTLARSINTSGQVSERIGILAPNSQSKLERFNLMLPDIKAGKLFLPEDMSETELIKEVLKELNGVTSTGIVSRRDDWLDSYAMLGAMKVRYPADNTVDEVRAREDSDGDDAYNQFWGEDFNDTNSGNGGYFV